MKLLLDQGLPRSAVSYLLRVGIESVHVGEIGLAPASDATILEFACSATCLTPHCIGPSVDQFLREKVSEPGRDSGLASWSAAQNGGGNAR